MAAISNQKKNTYLGQINWTGPFNPPLNNGTTLGLTTKGDLLVSNGTNASRLAVGADTFVLTADSSQTLGEKWAPVTNFSTRANGFLWSNAGASVSQSTTTNVSTVVLWGTNTGETISPATKTGMYQINYVVKWAAFAGSKQAYVTINGSQQGPGTELQAATTGSCSESLVIPVNNGQTIALEVKQTSGGNQNITFARMDWVFLGLQ